MYKYTKYEQETIINYNQGEEEASIYTYDPALKRKLDKACIKYPDAFALESSDKWGAKSYITSKKYISVKMPRTQTAEQREKQKEHMANMRSKVKSPYNKGNIAKQFEQSI